MSRTTTSFSDIQIPSLWEAIDADRRIQSAVIYCDGWVPNSYRYSAPGRCVRLVRTAKGWEAVEGTYDRKRSYGRGPYWVAFSERGGRLASR